MAVPTQSPTPPPYSEQAVRRMEHERQLLADERFMGWAAIWTMFGFKIGTVIVIMWFGRNSAEAGTDKWWAYLISTTWYWFFIPLVALSGFVALRLRLRKARKDAHRLRESEFSILETPAPEQLTEEEKARLRQLRRLDEQNR